MDGPLSSEVNYFYLKNKCCVRYIYIFSNVEQNKMVSICLHWNIIKTNEYTLYSHSILNWFQ